ncbi:RDD family protein [Verrucomicrobiota bacterium]
MQWYYAEAGEKAGPFEEKDFQELVKTGKVTENTLVWNETMKDWIAYASLGNKPEPVPVQTTPESTVSDTAAIQTKDTGVCCECGASFSTDDMIQYEGSTVCAQCKPVFFQRLQEGAVLPGVFEYGGFWIRFGAKFVDGLILGVINMVISMIGFAALMGAASTGTPQPFSPVQFLIWGLQMGASLSYTVFFLGKFGATPGKMACRLKVIRSDGSPVTYGRAVGRYFAEMLSGLIMNIGYIMAAFDDEKRTLHDRICDTRVIKKQ